MIHHPSRSDIIVSKLGKETTIQRFHIQFARHRTTVSVDKILSAMLAIKLGQEPETPAAHRAVREWLQERLPDKVGNDRGIGKRTSQHAKVLIVEEIADKKLSSRYDAWVTR